MNEYLQIFKYLKAFSKLRNKTIYDIHSSPQYKNIIWLADIPYSDSFYNAVNDRGDEKKPYWLELKKPKEPEAPEKPRIIPPTELIEWIEEESLYDCDDDNVPTLRQEIERDGATLYLDDNAQLNDSLECYTQRHWLDDLIIFQEKDKRYKDEQEKYEEELQEYNQLNGIYKKFFQLHLDLNNNIETHELIIGVGLFSYKEDNNSRKYYRHIITQVANIEYSSRTADITIKADDKDPTIERECINEIFNTGNIDEAVKEFEKHFEYYENEGNNVDLDLLDKQVIKTIIRSFSNHIGVDEYDDKNSKPDCTDRRNISYAPALILRQKSTSKLDEIYTKIIGTVSHENIGRIDSLDILLDNNQVKQTHIPDDNRDAAPEEDIVYFPNPYNNEQIRILEKIKSSSVVVVQGPPGTGKSHTIANLICHLLANGKKVLATAYTKRALEVLKNKLPEEYQSLAVNYLGNDGQSKEDLTGSVNAIIRKMGAQGDGLEEIKSDEEKLDRLKREIAKNNNERRRIMKNDAEGRVEFNQEHSGKRSDVLFKLQNEKVNFKWYEDDYSDINDDELKKQLTQFITLKEECVTAGYEFKQLSDFDSILDLDELIKPELVVRYNKLSSVFSSAPEQILVRCDDLDDLAENLKKLDELSKEIQSLYQGKSLNDFVQQCENSPRLIEIINLLPSMEELEEIDWNLTITYPDKELHILKQDAKGLLNYSDTGKKLRGLIFFCKKPFLSSDIKEKLYFTDSVKVNGSPCDTEQELKQVIKDIEIKQRFKELSEICPPFLGEIRVHDKKYKNQLETYQSIIEKAGEFERLKSEANELKEKIEQSSDLEVQYLDANNISNLLARIGWTEWKNLSDDIATTQEYLGSKEQNYFSCEKLSEKINFKQPKQYQEFYRDIKKLNILKQLKKELDEKIPKTIKQILDDDPDDPFDIIKFTSALFFKHAETKMSESPKENIEALNKEIKDGKDEERKLISSIGANKAWGHVSDSLNNNSGLETELKLWQAAISKIGMSNSRRTRKWQKIAKEKMQKCKTLIPCWIMPLYQLVDTIMPEQGMYDYIIVDEASQLGIDAMLLLYLGKKIIVVGDDKQTSPEYVGLHQDDVGRAITKHLKGVPNKVYYGTEFSFFDFVSLHFRSIVLKEHFRCMPEIIEFSNKLFYAPDQKQLHPLRQYSNTRLPPLEHFFCNDGYIESKGSTIKNKPEAEAIVNKITEIIGNPDYEDKTIGIITLQGNTQKKVINELLLEKIGDKEYTERKIICGDAASLQGDERDIIFLSLVTAYKHVRRALTKKADERRFNVAVSRAKDQVWLFHSVQLADIKNQNDLRYKLLSHITTYKTPEFQREQLIPVPRPKIQGKQPEPFRSWFEVEVFNDIVTKGYPVMPAHKVARYEIDLVPICADGTKIAVECDGDYWHHDDNYDKDMERQDVLERSGWQFFRIRYSDYVSNCCRALDPLWNLLEEHANKSIMNSGNQETTIKNNQQERKTDLPQNTSNKQTAIFQTAIFDDNLNNQSSQVLLFLNLYESGDFVLSKNKLDNVDTILAIESKYKNGYLLQCYDNGHVNKLKVSVLLERTLDKEYKNGFNTKVDMPELILIEKDEIIGMIFDENGSKKFKAHLTEKLPEKENLSIQGYKVIYNDNVSSIKWRIIPIQDKGNINRLVFSRFNARGKEIDKNHYEEEWHYLKLK